MNPRISLSPDELDKIVNDVIAKSFDNVVPFLHCICNKKRSKRCPKHNYIMVSTNLIKNSYLRIGDRILNEQLKSIKNESTTITAP